MAEPLYQLSKLCYFLGVVERFGVDPVRGEFVEGAPNVLKRNRGGVSVIEWELIVVVASHVRARNSGVEIEANTAIIFSIADGVFKEMLTEHVLQRNLNVFTFDCMRPAEVPIATSAIRR